MQYGRLPDAILEQYAGGDLTIPVVLYGAHEDGQIHVAGGLMWADGRCVGFLDVFQDFSSKSLTLVRWAKRVLRVAKQLGETEVIIYRDEWHLASERLVSLLGFEMVGIVAGDDPASCKEIFACRV